MSGFAIDTGDSGGSGGTVDEDDDTDDTDDYYDDTDDTSTDSDDSDGGIVTDGSEYDDDPRSNPDNWDGDTDDGGEDDTSWDDIDFSDDADGGVGGIVPDEEDDVTEGDYAIPEELRAEDGESLRAVIGEYLGVSEDAMQAVTMEQMTDLRNAVIDFNTGDGAERAAAEAEFTEAAQAIIETAETGEAPADDEGDEENSAVEGLPSELAALLSGDRTTSVGGREVPTVGLVVGLAVAGYAVFGGE